MQRNPDLKNAKRPGASPGVFANNSSISKFYIASTSAGEQERIDAEREQRIDRLRLELLDKSQTDERLSLRKQLNEAIASASTIFFREVA